MRLTTMHVQGVWSVLQTGPNHTSFGAGTTRRIAFKHLRASMRRQIGRAN